MTDLDVYQPASGELSQLAMTPDQAKALDDQVRLCTAAVLREGTDYGIIPGTKDKSLWRPGAQKMLQWFRLGYTCERTEIERGDDGRKHGISYRAEVRRRHPDGSYEILATCEGTADYDETKFYQTAEDRQRRAEDDERRFAHRDQRPPRPTRWQGLPEYRADWNALMKRAQKRAIVGAVVDATAAGGIFSDREEDDHAPVPAGDGPTWYEEALEAALTFTDKDTGRQLYVQAQQAHKDGLCNRRQMDHVQNRITQRARLLKTATPADVEDIARQAAEQDAATDAAGSPEDQPGSITAAQLTKLHTVLTGLGFNGEDREQKLVIAEVITGRAPLTGPATQGRSSKNLSLTEAGKLIDTLDGFDGRDALIAYMAEHEQAGDDGA